MSCVTRIPWPCNGSSTSRDPSKLPDPYGEWRIYVRAPASVGAGAAGRLSWRLAILLQISPVVEVWWAGDCCLDARWVTKSVRKALTETTMIATEASACSQNITHAESTWSWPMFPPATLMIAVIAVKMLRHRIPQSANLRRRLILTFQSKITGIDTTAAMSM